MYYYKGIVAYIGVLCKRKPDHRQGGTQHLNVSYWLRPLLKTVSREDCELSSMYI